MKVMNGETAHRGDVELSEVGGLLADGGRCRMLLALLDQRALAASVLADEAGVSRSTASSHLAKLTDGGLLRVETHGRHRYYRLAGPEVGDLLERLTGMSPTRPVRSLREGSRAAQLRAARTCYDHLAGRVGVGVMANLVAAGHLSGGDGRYEPDRDGADRLSSYGREVDYALTPGGAAFLDQFGVRVPDGTRPLLRYCVDWSEQRHHLAGRLGRGLLDRLFELDWIRRRPANRSVLVTDAGRAGFADTFGVVA